MCRRLAVPLVGFRKINGGATTVFIQHAPQGWYCSVGRYSPALQGFLRPYQRRSASFSFFGNVNSSHSLLIHQGQIELAVGIAFFPARAEFLGGQLRVAGFIGRDGGCSPTTSRRGRVIRSGAGEQFRQREWWSPYDEANGFSHDHFLLQRRKQNLNGEAGTSLPGCPLLFVELTGVLSCLPRR